MVGSEIGAQGAIGVFVGTRHDLSTLSVRRIRSDAPQSVESLRRRPADIGHSALSFAVRLPETAVRYPHVSGHEEARAGGHEISGSVDINRPGCEVVADRWWPVPFVHVAGRVSTRPCQRGRRRGGVNRPRWRSGTMTVSRTEKHWEGTMWELPIEGGIPWLVWLLDLVINGS